ncbi:MAG: DNA-3-methyladenine glycosylase 2 family protein [Bacteroidia bacterium]|nr:DNA-3-methyladenine glycosylase 2 family protein [Bacteroidia bacterium]
MENKIIIHLTQNDEILGQVIALTPLKAVHNTHNVFYDLTSCIVGQQIHYRREVPVFRKFLDLFPERLPTPENMATISTDAVQALKISQAKFETLLTLSEYWLENHLEDAPWETLSDEEVRTHLSAVKGVGSWTIDMILLFTLERPDIFPYQDYHLKQMMTQLYGLNPKARLKEQMTNIANKWTPYKSFAVKYLLSWKEFNQSTFK